MSDSDFEGGMSASDLYEIGMRMLGNGDLHGALVFFEASARLEPHNGPLQRIGECYLALGRPREAIVPLAAAATLANNPKPMALLAKLFFDLQDLESARKYASAAVTMLPHFKEMHDLIAQIDSIDRGPKCCPPGTQTET